MGAIAFWDAIGGKLRMPHLKACLAEGMALSALLVAVATAGVISLIAHFLVGAAKSLFTLRTWWSAGLEMTGAGVLVGGITYAVGVFLH